MSAARGRTEPRSARRQPPARRRSRPLCWSYGVRLAGSYPSSHENIRVAGRRRRRDHGRIAAAGPGTGRVAQCHGPRCRPGGERPDLRGRPGGNPAVRLLHPASVPRRSVHLAEYLHPGLLSGDPVRAVVQRHGCGPSSGCRRRTGRRPHPDHPVRAQPGRPGHLHGAAQLGSGPVECPGSGQSLLGLDRQSGERSRRSRPQSGAGRLALHRYRGDPTVRRMGRCAH